MQTVEGNEQRCSKPGNGNRFNKENPKQENLDVKNLGIQTGTVEASLSSRTQETEQRTPGVEDTCEEIVASVKEDDITHIQNLLNYEDTKFKNNRNKRKRNIPVKG